MRVLIACEESQEVCKAFRAKGHEAYSCDIQECSGGHKEWHIMGDVLKILNPKVCRIPGDEWYGFKFRTQDGVLHCVLGKWDLIIAHPPCTYLTSASAVRLYNKDHSIKDYERFKNGIEGAKFFMEIWNADCDRIVIENPTPMKVWNLPKYSQIIEPYFFGDPWKKRTCLWLKQCKPLEPTDVVHPKGLWVGSTSGRRDNTVYSRYSLKSNRDPKIRSKTFPGIAKAMAEQWGTENEP